MHSSGSKPDTPTSVAQSERQGAVCTAVLEQFEAAWRAAGEIAPDIRAFAGSSPDSDLIVELCKIDMEYRWKSSEQVVAVKPLLRLYCEQFPELDRSTALVELAAEEFWVRTQWGDRPALDDFLGKYPECQEMLQAEIQRIAGDFDPPAESMDDHAEWVGDIGRVSTHGIRDGAEMPELDGFDMRRVIGVGASGIVYEARQLVPGRTVAVKVLQNGGKHSHAIARFEAEVKIIASLHHPNIVTLLSVGRTHERVYCVLEYMDRGDLRKLLNESRFEPRQAAELIRILALAVDAAHGVGVLHRDLKPENVLIASVHGPTPSAVDRHEPLHGTVVKISDFGLAKKWHADDGPDEPPVNALTETGAILGTPSYMAPEQVMGSPSTIGPSVDIYALGAILYELLVGRAPFRGLTTIETLDEVRFREPVAPRVIQPQLPFDLQTICMQCLQKEPQRRYGSAKELAEDLQAFLDGRPIAARPIGVVERSWKWMRRNVAWTLCIATIAIATLASIGGLWGHNRLLQAEVNRANRSEQEARRQKQRVLNSFEHGHDKLLEMLRDVEREQRNIDEPVVNRFRENVLATMYDYYDQAFSDPAADHDTQQPGDGPELEREDDRLRLARATFRVYAGEVRHYEGDHTAALQEFQSVAREMEELARKHANEADYQYGLALLHYRWAQTLIVSQDQNAELHLKTIVDLVARLEHRAKDTRLLRVLGRSYNDLVLILSSRGDRHAAQEYAALACKFWPAVLQRDLDSSELRLHYAHALKMHHWTLLSAVDIQAAEEPIVKCEDLLAPWLERLPDDHFAILATGMLAEMYFRMSAVATERQEYEESERWRQKSRDLIAEILRVQPREAQATSTLAGTYWIESFEARIRGDLPLAIEKARTSMLLSRGESRQLAAVHLAQLHCDNEELDDARQILQQLQTEPLTGRAQADIQDLLRRHPHIRGASERCLTPSPADGGALSGV